jgi:hypothetical protein
VCFNGGRVEYVTDQGKNSLYWNIPIANTTSLLLGTGTSITQAAMRELGKAGVLVGFCGGGGTPLYSANEVEVEVAWFAPQSEYRPTEYLQHWVRFWFDDGLRLEAAKAFQRARLGRIAEHWCGNRQFADNGFQVPRESLLAALEGSRHLLDDAPDNTALLAEEARLTKKLFKFAVDAVDYGGFTRAKNGTGTDPANRFLGPRQLSGLRIGRPPGYFHCRIGSSENVCIKGFARTEVHCRIGSSEKAAPASLAMQNVHCRIGNSDGRSPSPSRDRGQLPDRQSKKARITVDRGRRPPVQRAGRDANQYDRARRAAGGR